MVNQQTFAQSRRNLWSELNDLCSLVEARVQKVCNMLTNGSPDKAKEIISSDYEIDDMQIIIEEHCIRLIALHQPMARDLRLLMGTYKINDEVERIGDMAVNIATRIRTMDPADFKNMPIDFTPMCDQVLAMFRQSLDALLNQDLDLAHQTFLLDEVVDDQCSEIYDLVNAKMCEPDASGPVLLNMHLLAGYLERIADRSVNIAEEVIFMVEGEIIREKQYELQNSA